MSESPYGTTIEERITQTVEQAVTRALQDHVPPVAVSVVGACQALNLSEPTVRKLVADGHLARVPNVGQRVLISVRELERFADQGLEAVPDVA